jgi:hypothetical protein
MTIRSSVRFPAKTGPSISTRLADNTDDEMTATGYNQDTLPEDSGSLPLAAKSVTLNE